MTGHEARQAGESTSLPIYLPPDWMGIDDADRLELFNLGDGARLEFGGALRRALLDGSALRSPAFRTVARLNPDVERLATCLQHCDPVPLTRATLLRGSSFRRLFLELTARCNERCVHCYAESGPTRSEALDASTVRQVLEDARQLGFQSVQLTGGDPLLSEVCASAARWVRQLGFAQLEIYTNGLALRGELYEELRAVEPDFAFSFYSHDADTHDRVTRTPGSQRRTVEAMKRVLADGLSMRVGVILTDENRDHADQVLRYLANLGIPRECVGIDVQRGVGRGEFTPPPASGHKVVTGRTHAPRDERAAFGGTAAVAYDGNVYPCIFSRGLALGDVHQTRLAEILTAPHPVHVDRCLLLEGHQRWSDRLSCWPCRLRAALLAPSPPAEASA